jgi:hypothetical protein
MKKLGNFTSYGYEVVAAEIKGWTPAQIKY